MNAFAECDFYQLLRLFSFILLGVMHVFVCFPVIVKLLVLLQGYCTAFRSMYSKTSKSLVENVDFSYIFEFV